MKISTFKPPVRRVRVTMTGREFVVIAGILQYFRLSKAGEAVIGMTREEIEVCEKFDSLCLPLGD